jgi:hypothetical protein
LDISGVLLVPADARAIGGSLKGAIRSTPSR